MTTLYLVLPLALAVAAVSVLAFAWSVRSGQLDDLDTPPHRLLLDDGDRAGFAPPAQIPALRAPSLTGSQETPLVSRPSDWHEL
jgi:cbb3-type cytochrome oxidase maturation protein